LERAKARVKVLAVSSPGEYIILNQKTGEKISIRPKSRRILFQIGYDEKGLNARAELFRRNFFHLRHNIFYRHRIPLGETDAVSSRPSLQGQFRVRCDLCGKEYLYKPSDVSRVEKEIPESFIPHPLFRDEQA